MIVRVRAVQGYSTEITSALLDESRKGVNARYEDETQKRIPVYLLGPNVGQEDSVSAKIELGMPGVEELSRRDRSRRREHVPGEHHEVRIEKRRKKPQLTRGKPLLRIARSPLRGTTR